MGITIGSAAGAHGGGSVTAIPAAIAVALQSSVEANQTATMSSLLGSIGLGINADASA